MSPIAVSISPVSLSPVNDVTTCQPNLRAALCFLIATGSILSPFVSRYVFVFHQDSDILDTNCLQSLCPIYKEYSVICIYFFNDFTIALLCRKIRSDIFVNTKLNTDRKRRIVRQG